jgi:hypothetical protein
VSAERELVSELVRLRRGWGLQSRDLRARMGPELMRLCGVVDTDGDRDIRDKFRVWFDTVSVELPPELAYAARVALTLDRGHQHPRLTRRVESLAGEQSWAPRTARRRMDDAMRLVAQAAVGGTVAGAVDGSGEGAGPPAARAAMPSALAAVVRLEATRHGPQDARLVTVRVPVPRDRFDLLITFEAVEGVTRSA